MHSCLQFLLCLVAFGNAVADNEAKWNDFKSEYGKQYKHADEEQRRMKIFAANLATVEAHNILYQEGKTSYEMGINEFSDMDSTAFLATMTGDRHENLPDAARTSLSYVPVPDISSLPEEIDWRDKGYVTPVKHQGTCGSCWAFSTTGVLEGQHFRKTGKLVSLSEQQLVDCDKSNSGCDGGSKGRALTYIAKNGGINSNETYPYEGKFGMCRYDSKKIAATCKRYVDVEKSESALQAAVAKIGPIAVSIDCRESFRQYKNGIYDDPECRNDTTTHAVLVVGYGRTPVGKPYWIVKNSWGTKWGKEGYILMSRNKQSQCAIATFALYAVV